MKVNRIGIFEGIAELMNYFANVLRSPHWSPIPRKRKPQRILPGGNLRRDHRLTEDWAVIEARRAEAQALARFPIAR